MLARLFVALQHVLPQRLLSNIVHVATQVKWAPWKNGLIRLLSRIYAIDLDEPVRRAPHEFSSFADFFTRELKSGARPMAPDPDAIVCPADGRISAMGAINADRILQAKGHHYSLSALLAGREDLVSRFTNGTFATVYLAPSNYHRVHAPAAGVLLETIYVPGRLFSVSPATVDHVPDLFARNERLICIFESPNAGHMVVIFVGAMLVSGIETVWSGAQAHGSAIETHVQSSPGPTFARGDELGRFNMGSTVIVLFEPGRAALPDLAALTPVRMGQPFGELLGPEQGPDQLGPTMSDQ